jgi:nitroimidazol reductase NimA-like FMN-containing flavoprotein (pyridoxamine 5'-phosphate oxidase superfamily)
MTDDLLHSERTTVRRIAKRGVYDRATIHSILDAGMICHVGFAVEGQPFVIPTIYVRIGETICLHGSSASRMLRALAAGVQACITVTIVDGLVLARSAFHHSMNYRSAVILGTASRVDDPGEKTEILRCLSEHVIRGRWDEVRWPAESELKQTMVVAIPIREASAKIRSGPPLDEEPDYALPVWAGVLPLQLAAGKPIADPRLAASIDVPAYVRDYRRGS